MRPAERPRSDAPFGGRQSRLQLGRLSSPVHCPTSPNCSHPNNRNPRLLSIVEHERSALVLGICLYFWVFSLWMNTTCYKRHRTEYYMLRTASYCIPHAPKYIVFNTIQCVLRKPVIIGLHRLFMVNGSWPMADGSRNMGHASRDHGHWGSGDEP